MKDCGVEKSQDQNQGPVALTAGEFVNKGDMGLLVLYRNILQALSFFRPNGLFRNVYIVVGDAFDLAIYCCHIVNHRQL